MVDPFREEVGGTRKGTAMSRARIRRTGLAIVAVAALTASGLPLNAAVAAPSIDVAATVRAAAYLGADELSETSLPASVTSGGESHAVEWLFDASTFAVPYASVQIDGDAQGVPVSAIVEVLPPPQHPLVYYVDSGHNGDSQSTSYSNLLTTSTAFESAVSLAGSSLRNTAPDQRYVAGTTEWGWLSDATNNYKISTVGGDPNPADAATLGAYGKYELGVRTNGTQIGFRLDLAPGTYTLSSGFYEFYAGSQSRSRGIAPTIAYAVGGQQQQITLEKLVLNTASGAAPVETLLTDAFTIPEGATDVALTYAKSSGEAPVLSWFSIVDGDAENTIDDAVAADAAVFDVAVDASKIAADNRNGLTFKGFGTLSANSTSAVLMDYKSQHPEKYAELIRTLFGGEHPIMNQVKIEMGNDRNNSTGSDVATMRTADEPANVTRHPGFQLAADARKVNPHLHVSILRWNAPAWADSNDKIYTWYKNTILAAYREYGYMVDSVNPGVNEHAADLNWTKDFSNRVRTDTVGYVSGDASLAGFRGGEADLFHQIRTVISDEVGTGSFGGAMVSDAELRDAVQIAGFHYNTDDDSAGNFKKLAQDYDVEVWNSEAQATFSNSSFRPNNNTADPSVAGTGFGGTGSALEMANTVVKGFVNSNRTHFIYQPAIGSFYEGGQYSFKELVGARDPWSGWIHYDGALSVLQHFSSFAVTGWENDDNTAGIWRAVPSASASTATGTNPVNGRNGQQNYMTLAAPDRSDFSTVIVNDSEKALKYRITPTNFTFGSDEKLAVWETRAADAGEQFNANHKQHVGDLARSGGGYTVTIKPYSIVTVTSLDVSDDAAWTSPLPVEGERTVLDDGAANGVLWQDGFDYSDRTVPVLDADGEMTGETEPFVASRGGETGAIPLYTWDRNGAFEAYRTASDGYVLRQQLDRDATGVGGAWNGGDPITAVGDRRWTNYSASVDVRFERDAASDNYAAVGARSSGGDNSQSLGSTAYVLRLNSAGTWLFQRRGSTIVSGTVAGTWSASAWHKLKIAAAGDRITGWIDGEQVFDWTDADPYRSGWVDLASGFHNTQFDNLRIESVDGYLPYYGEYLDDQEMTDLSAAAGAKLVYDGTWAHANGGGMYQYQRSMSSSSTAGAGVTYTFTGSGIDLLAPGGDAAARIDVSVDGQPLVRNVATQAAGQFQAAYSLRGLPWGQHTVRLSLASGSIALDAVAVASAPATEPPSTDALSDAVLSVRDITRTDDYTDADWALFQHALAQAESAVADPAVYRLDGEGAAQLESRLRAATFPLAAQIRSLSSPTVATEEGETPLLPQTLTATLVDDTTREVPITWELQGTDFSEPWASVAVTGVYGSATTTAHVEVVPAGTEYFADINATATSSLGFDSPSYLAVRELLGDGILNPLPDQALGGDRTWGHWGKNAAGTSTTNYKGTVAGAYDKLTTTGLYAADQVGSSIGYTLTLPAGTHTIAAGSHSWWPAYPRTADVTLTYGGSSHSVGTVTLDASTPSKVLSYEIELAEAGAVTIALTSTNNQSPMLSWVAASAEQAAAPVSAAVTTRCVAGKVVQVVTITNDGDSSATVSVASPFGKKAAADLPAGKSTSHAFSTRQTQIGESTVTVIGESAAGRAFELTVTGVAASCR